MCAPLWIKADLLREALARGIAAFGSAGDYVDKLLAAMPAERIQFIRTKDERPTTKPQSPSFVVRLSSTDSPGSALVEPLNDREMQILRLLAAGLSNRQIAEELFLSVNTVKWYTS